MTTATADLTPFQRLLFSHLPAGCPAKHLQSSAGIPKSRVTKILRHRVVPNEPHARAISEGLHIPWATVVDAARASCHGRPLPIWALRGNETPGHWAGYHRPPNRAKAHPDCRPISRARWVEIVSGLHPGPLCVIDPGQVLRDWRAFGATAEQVAWGCRQLGVKQ